MDPKEIETLRGTTEDVAEAVRDAYFGEALAGIDPAVLLEFHNRMLDLKLGTESDAMGVAILPALEPETRH